MINKPRLTLVIPTYNRSSQLRELLTSIEKQGHRDEFKVLICDNHSDYDITQSLLEGFDRNFIDIITIKRWPFNTGMSTNISIPFLFIDTEWCWIIGDDDTITDGAIEIILNQIQEFPRALAIKNSLKDFIKHKDLKVSSIESFIEYYSNKKLAGEMMYLSMVYNMKELCPYLSKVTEYSYSHLSFLIPILFGLINGGYMVFSSFEAIRYRSFANDNWASARALPTVLGIRTILDVDFGLNDKTTKSLNELLIRGIKIGFCLRALLTIPSNYRRRQVWQNLMPMIKMSNPWYNILVCWLVLSIYNFLGINILSIIIKIKSRL